MADAAPERDSPTGGGAGSSPPSFYGAVFASFSLLALWIYAAALRGPFVSDDMLYITGNPWVVNSVPNLYGSLFDPKGSARLDAGGNYAPVHLLAHVFQWRVFGPATLPYHLVNVALHAGNATLLVALLRAASVGRTLALLAGLFFLVHPANVEAVAWISQLKSVLALAFALGGLLLFRAHPLASVPLFALALLTKAIAGFALPMAAGLWWSWRRDAAASPRVGLGLLLYVAIFAVFAPIQLSAFGTGGASLEVPYPDALTQLRSMSAIGARYLAMAASGFGTSAFHQPGPVTASGDPWWLAGLAFAAFFLWRIAVTLRDRREEAGWWLGAAAAYVPVCQFYPFFFGMGDRYLYFVLPGLLGGAVLMGRSLWGARARELRFGAAAPVVAVAVAALVLGLLAREARSRAPLWRNEELLLADAAANYPDGAVAHFRRGVAAIDSGNFDRAVEQLRAAADRGANDHRPFRVDSDLEPLRGHPSYEALLDDLARRDIAIAGERELTSQAMLRRLAISHYRLGQLDEAIAVLEDAIRRGGPRHAELLTLHGELRSVRAQRKLSGPR